MTTSSTSLSADGQGGPEPEGRLHRDLGVWSIVLMVVAAAAPMGAIVGLMPVTIISSGSLAVPQFYLIAAVILTLFAVGFTTMSRFVPNAGAFYSYIQAGLGRHLGTASAALALGSYIVLLVGVNAYVGVATSNVIEKYTDATVPWWLLSIASLVLVALLGYRDIELSAKVLGLLLVAETLALVLVGAVVLIKGGSGGISGDSLSPSQLSTGTPTIGLMLAIFGFIGFEATAVFRHEAREPDRTIPRATYVAVIFIGIFYAVSSWTILEGAGKNALELVNADPENFVLDVAGDFVGVWLQDTMQVLVVTSQFAVVLAFHNVVTRYQFTLAKKGILPAKLADVSERHNAPSFSSLVASAISIVAMIIVWVTGLDPILETYTWLSGAATLGLVVLMALTSLAVVMFFRHRGDGHSIWTTTVAPAVSFVLLAIVTFLVVKNFSLLVGGTKMAAIIGGIIAATFVAGLIGAEYLRRARPDKYEALLTND